MAKSKTSQLSKPEEERNVFDEILSKGKHKLVTQKTPGIITVALPQTTCHFGIHCDHKGQPEPGTYRFSVERVENAMSATHPIGSRGIQNLSTVLRSPTLMGHGKGGEIWICLTCYEGVLDGKLYRKLFGDGTDPGGLHQLIEWLNFIEPETRSLPGFPVHRRLVYLCENPSVKKLLDDGVYVEKAFPSDLFPALNGDEALYLDAETRDFKGYAPNKKPAELRWDQVLNTKLSDSLEMSDQLVDFLESEGVDVSSDESEGPQERSSGEEESHQSDSDNGEEDSGEEDSEEAEEDSGEDNEEEKRQATARMGQKRLRDSSPTVKPAANGPHGDQDTDSEGEERRSKRAKLAWKGYLRSSHCS